MEVIRYGKKIGYPGAPIYLKKKIKRMGDFFLQRGFESQFYGASQMDPARSMEALREAILRALQEGDLLFVQAEDGIRDADVTGVQTCALPILLLIDATTQGAETEKRAVNSGPFFLP